MLHAAQLLAQKQQHAAVTEEHILAGLLQEDIQALPYLMEQNNILLSPVKAALKQHLNRQATVEGSAPQLSAAAVRCLQNALQFAQKRGDAYVATLHLLYSILESRSTAAQILKDAGMQLKQLEKTIEKIQKGEKINAPNAEQQFQALEKYAKNLNTLARENKLDPVIGRDDEIRRLLQILSRRTKNNPILVGEPGTGKNGHSRRTRA